MPEALIVVPCFNEAARFDADAFRAILDDPRIDLLFVDDGSTDATREVLGAFCASSAPRASLVALPANAGKGEAVRHGLREALRRGARIVGYLDADLATPPSELRRLLEAMIERGTQVTLASRVRLLGRRIGRRPGRHYLGRVFATTASLVLGLPVYDTQCGAKLFLAGPPLAAALERPFVSRWAFDVELLGRLLVRDDGSAGVPADAFLEVPLERWSDVAGSKLRLSAMARSGVDLARIAVELRGRRSRGRRRVTP